MKGRMRKCSINDKDNDNGLSERKVSVFLEPNFSIASCFPFILL